jgi:hypothetical protein
VSGFGAGFLQFINTTTSFSSDDTSLAVSTFGIQIRFTSASDTDCVMLGNNSNANCIHVFDWPASHDDASTNGAISQSLTDVQSAEYDKGVGDYSICIHNSAPLTTVSAFNGTADFFGLTVEESSTLAVTSAISEVFEVTYDVTFRQG